MDQWLLGAILTMVVTAPQFRISSGMLQIQATAYAFAAILADGSVVAWGNPDHGGDCSPVQDPLKSVQQIQATEGAFAAIWVTGCLGSVRERQ